MRPIMAWRLDLRELLAALGAAGVDHSAAAAGLHADEKAMGTGTANFGRLVSALHGVGLWLVTEGPGTAGAAWCVFSVLVKTDAMPSAAGGSRP